MVFNLGDPPKFTNASFWRDNETTWNLHFSPPTLLEGFTSTKSVLRLLKIIPVSEIAHATKTGDCSKDDELLIRITISAYTKKNKKGIYKKLTNFFLFKLKIIFLFSRQEEETMQ